MLKRSMEAFGAFIALLLVPASLSAADQPGRDDVPRLIDALIEITEPGFGYSVYFSGSEFLPYEGTGEPSSGVLGAMRATRSETLKKLVELGADAVPDLLEHIDDDRELKMEPLSGMMWMDYSNEYDFNRRTRDQPPQGVNRGLLSGDTSESEESENAANDGEPADRNPREHALTVGDVCFVALGQIVNRRYSASRYQPTGGLVINSPTHSKALRTAILADWSGLTREKHKNLLIEDFLHPDHEDRRIGAYYRLAFYYPDAVEPLVLDELAKPVVDAFAIYDFCHNTLYKTEDKEKRRELYDAFIREHGKLWAEGIQDQHFDDLAQLEYFEERERKPEFGSRPRELLIALFNHPANVKSSDRPPLHLAYAHERQRLIDALTHDESRRIGDVVKSLLIEAGRGTQLAVACLRCLANRGYADFLIEQLDTLDVGQVDRDAPYYGSITAIAESRDPRVRARLLELVKTTSNDAYFMAALPAIDRQHEALILERAKVVLNGLPDDSEQGEALLQMIGERFPDDAEDIYQAFLANGSAQRAATMCSVLWYGSPLSEVILAPLLDDKRSLKGFSIPMRVCDRAAEALSHAVEVIEFDSEWDTAKKDRQIKRLKEYCRNKATK